MDMVPEDFQSSLKRAIDSKTKPVGSLGRIETLAAQLAMIQNSLKPVAERCQLTIFAADHGMARAGVSVYPQDVTRQMVANFLAGGAAANVFSKTLGVEVQVVDCGVAGDPIETAALRSCRIAAGTANAIERPAMNAHQCASALANGRQIGLEGRHHAACFGEMGIGNTSSASLIAAKILGEPVDELVGRGTGLEADGVRRKRALLESAASRTPAQLTPVEALTEYGGFEIATMAGAMTGAAESGKIVIVDGFIATAAALCARKIFPGCERNFVYAHRSAEAGHKRLLDALDATPLLDLDMRLGEGTGALLAWPLVQAAAAMLRDMASFDSAGVSGPA